MPVLWVKLYLFAVKTKRSEVNDFEFEPIKEYNDLEGADFLVGNAKP